MFSRRNDSHSSLDIWPGFVDALATLLIVVIFVLMTFVVSQLSLTDALQGRDQALSSLNHKLQQLTKQLELEQKNYLVVNQQKQQLEESLGGLQQAVNTFKITVTDLELAKKAMTNQNDELTIKLTSLSQELANLQGDLQSERQEKQAIVTQAQQNLASKSEELNTLQRDFDTLKQDNDKLLKQQLAQSALNSHSKNNMGQFRSEFLAKVLNVIGNRADVRVVGDRFIFQSEVLFSKASAELGKDGKQKLDQLIDALKQIAKKIPGDLPWVLRIDGHTDHLPINTSQFPSNWELSSARAIAVVKYMVERGIPPHNLVAAAFGEHQPLNSPGKESKNLARDRRIEFKLDQR